MAQLSLFSQPKLETGPSYWTVFIDGASRNNPGHAGAGIYIVRDGSEIFEYGFYVGIKTNNEAEYYALLLGLFFVQFHAQPTDHVRIVSDSLLVVKQVQGLYRVKKSELQLLQRCAVHMMKERNAHIMHVLRSENTNADRMANEGIDKKNPVPADFIAFLKKHEIFF